MVVGLLSSVMGFIFKPISQLILYLGLPFLLFFEKSVTFFGEHAALVEVLDVSLATTIGYYVLILSVFLFVWTKNKK